MDSSACRHLTLSVFGLTACFATANAQEQTPQTEPAPVHITQRPQQLLPTGEEDAPARAQDFASRSATISEQALDEKLRRMTSESTDGLKTVRAPNGAVGMDLDGRFMSVIVGKLREDGSYELSCHTGHEAISEAHHAADILEGRAEKLKRSLPPVTIVDKQPVLEEK